MVTENLGIFQKKEGVPEGTLAGMFRPSFPLFLAESHPRDPPRSWGPAPQIKVHEKSAPQTNSKAKWWRTKNPARQPSSTQTIEPPTAAETSYFRTGFEN